MSDNWFSFVAENPRWVPLNEGVSLALAELGRALYPQADDVQAIRHERVEFVHPGANLEEVRCPQCLAVITDQWSELMESWETGDRSTLDQSLPCCGAHLSLNDLIYDWPAAFGMFQLDIMNPNVPDVTPTDLHRFEQISGTPLRVVRTHL